MLPHIPRFDFGASSLVLTYPVTRWIPGARTNGLVLKAADGSPGSVVRLRKYTLAMALRFTEAEWPAVSEFINFGQTGAEFEFFHGEDTVAIPASFTATLGAPRIAAGVRPTRDGNMPWLMLLPIVLESTEGWFVEYFGDSSIPHIDAVIFVNHVTVVLADTSLNTVGSTTATATLFDRHDDIIDPFDRVIEWTSSDVDVATVDADGNVTVQGPGVCNIIATCEGVSGFDTLTVAAQPALVATGGTMFQVGDDFIYHVFDASADFVVESGDAFVEYLIVAGGGGGGGSQDRTGGGGGGGGVKEFTGVALGPGTYPVVVGAGGLGGKMTPSSSNAVNGSNSSFNGQSATGGGRGEGWSATAHLASNGGSGGGAKHGTNAPGTGVAGQGFAGGAGGFNSGSGSGTFTGSGGGGASEVGVQGTNVVAGRGGNGYVSDITGVNVTYGGGGGGSAGNYGGQNIQGGAGGAGGGGAGATGLGVATPGGNGTDGRGGGGGASAVAGANAGNGGRGVVIIRYPMI